MGNITSSNFNNLSIINFDKMLDFIDSNCIIINTLNENLQSCLIYNTIHSSNEVQLLNKYLTTDLYIEIIIYGKNSSDLSVFNNDFGREKIIYSMKYGIEIPIVKYIHELEEIEKKTSDDKSSKRRIRLQFLEICEKDPRLVLNNFFQQMMDWLNGGGDKLGPYHPGSYSFSQYYQQRLILIVSGGNIITIFAKLLINIIWVSEQGYQSSEVAFNNLTKTNREILNELEHYDYSDATNENVAEDFQQLSASNFNLPLHNKYQILEYIINYIRIIDSNFNNSFTNILKQLIESSGYSDFDYCLLPNKEPSTKENTQEDKDKINLLIRQIDSNSILKSQNQGFALFRIKSLILCNKVNKENVHYMIKKNSMKLLDHYQ